jgi:hypothetical protein
MSDDLFRLGRSSFEEVKNIIRGYAHFDQDVKLDDLARLLAINKAVISGNNSFLTDIGIIEGGRTKTITPLGRNLGRALEHNQEDDIKRYLREVIQGSEFLSDLVSTVRIRNGMTVDDLASHILYASGQTNSKSNRTGARTVVDMLVESDVLLEKEGHLQVATMVTEQEEKPSKVVPPLEKVEKETVISPKPVSSKPKMSVTPSPTIAINIQLHLPETENPAVYVELFKALRKHLLEPSSEENED